MEHYNTQPLTENSYYIVCLYVCVCVCVCVCVYVCQECI